MVKQFDPPGQHKPEDSPYLFFVQTGTFYLENMSDLDLETVSAIICLYC